MTPEQPSRQTLNFAGLRQFVVVQVELDLIQSSCQSVEFPLLGRSFAAILDDPGKPESGMNQR